MLLMILVHFFMLKNVGIYFVINVLNNIFNKNLLINMVILFVLLKDVIKLLINIRLNQLLEIKNLKSFKKLQSEE